MHRRHRKLVKLRSPNSFWLREFKSLWRGAGRVHHSILQFFFTSNDWDWLGRRVVHRRPFVRVVWSWYRREKPVSPIPWSISVPSLSGVPGYSHMFAWRNNNREPWSFSLHIAFSQIQVACFSKVIARVIESKGIKRRPWTPSPSRKRVTTVWCICILQRPNSVHLYYRIVWLTDFPRTGKLVGR